jgi:signal peptidase II
MSTSAQPEPSEHADTAAATTATDTPSRGPRRALVLWTVVLAVLVLAIDQLSKWWAESTLEVGADPVPLVGDLLSLRLIYNPGAALSIATGMTWLLTIVVVVVVVVIIRMVSRIGSRAWAVALGLLLGGALGNLVDRFFREPGFARGHVVDFIAYGNWFVGNVADIAIVGAAVMIAVLSVVGIGLDGTRHGRDETADQSQAEVKTEDVAGDATSQRAAAPATTPADELPEVAEPDPGSTTDRTEREVER